MLLQAAIMVCAVCLALLVLAPASYAAVILVDVNDPACIPLGAGPAYCAIQGAIDAASPGDTIHVAGGLYAEQPVLEKDDVTIDGASQATTIIDGTGASGYHFYISAAGVTVRDFTLLGNSAAPGSYGLKIEGDLGSSTQHAGITVENVTVDGSYRTGVDLNGIDGATLTNVTVRNVPFGNGIALTDVDNAVLTGITTTNNAWGGLAVYTRGEWFPAGSSDNIDLVSLSAGEPNPLYWEVGCVGTGCTPHPITDFTAPQFTHAVRNSSFLPGAENFTFFQYAETAAIDVALALTNPADSTINEFDGLNGLFGNFVVGNSAGAAMRIQAAIDAAVAGDTIEVRDGIYEESLTISEDITLIGDSTGAVVAAPAAVPTCFTGSTAIDAVVCVQDTTSALLDKLTIDGQAQGNGNYRYVGVAFHNAGGAVQNSIVTGIRDNPFSGAQHGVAIYSWNEDTVSRTINVLNNTILDFQKNAMALNADSDTPMVVNVTDNVITGAGATTVTAQNGIQVLGELITGVIDNNTVSGIAYDNTNDPTKWVATSILNYYAALDITNNTIFGGHLGIYNIEGAGALTGNSITIDKVGVYSFGIIATDPPDAIPSPFGEGSPGSRPIGRAPEAVLDIDITDNFLLFHGPDNSATYAVEADPGYGPNDFDLYLADNIIRGFDVGVELFECQSGCDAGLISALNVTNNCISTNNMGLRSNLTLGVGAGPIPAENNWWGDSSGPAPTGSGDLVVGNVDYDPWLSSCPLALPGDWQNLGSGNFYATLQMAVDDASPGDEILATGEGPYAGAAVATTGVTINLNGATLLGSSPALTVSAADVTLTNGILDGQGGSNPGVLIAAGGHNFILQDMEVTGWAEGVRVSAPVTSFKMVSNYVHDNSNAGLLMDSGAALAGVITIEGNLFKANGNFGVQNLNGVDLDATFNSWGCLDGPGNAGCDAVGTNVLFAPWTFSEIFLDMEPPLNAPVVDVYENESFDVELKVDAASLSALAFDLTYDDSMLTLDNVAFVAPWDGYCEAVVAPAPGRVYERCNLAPPPTSSGYSQAGSVIAVLSLTAENNGGLIDPGPWTTHFDVNHLTTDSASVGGVKVFVNNAGYGASAQPAIDDAQDGQVNITPTGQFAGFIDLQGRPNEAGGTVTVYDSSDVGTAVALAAGTSNSGGSYTTSNIGAGFLPLGDTFWLYADATLFLPTTADVSLFYSHSGVLTLRPITPLNLVMLRGGDATDDNFINVLDATCIGADFGGVVSTCSTGHSDVNADGLINILDLTLMGGNWQHGFSSWVPQ